jgi:hypothetical protein
MNRLMVVVLGLGAVGACTKDAPPPAPSPESPERAVTIETLRASEARALSREVPTCRNARPIFDGMVQVNSDAFTQSVERDGEFAEEPMQGLDAVVARARRFQFTLDYPFEKPFTGTIQGDLTVRKAVSAIRAGFRSMYRASTVRDIPGVLNRHVTGEYGEAFHDIDDLVIEGIDVCDDHTLRISIGS